VRILHISTRLILGGSQENTVLSCEGQARRGHDVHLAFGPIYGPEGSLLDRVERFRTADGRKITTHVVPHLVRQVNPWTDTRAYWELSRLIRELRPQVVHTHSSKAGVLGRWAAWNNRSHAIGGSSWADINRQAGWDLVDPEAMAPAREQMEPANEVSFCDVWIKTAIMHTIHGPPFMPIEGSTVGRFKVRANNAVYQAAERFAARRCHRIISVADAMTEQFLRRGIGEPSQYCTVYSGMETQCFLAPRAGETRGEIRARLGIAPLDLVIGTVARLAQHKGHDDLLDALGDDLRLRRGWKLLWVGDGWWRERLLRRVREMGLEKQVLTTGLVPPESVPGLIRAMDILAHPSSREGLPRTVPQALLCGVVPVAYDVDGTREVCRDMETGRLVEAGSVQGLRGAIEWLAERPDARQTMAERGRQECATKFSADRMVDELQRVYERALATARAGSLTP
jgi:glycosyltransferase involved in cell wall biosynthesis